MLNNVITTSSPDFPFVNLVDQVGWRCKGRESVKFDLEHQPPPCIRRKKKYIPRLADSNAWL